MSGKIVGLLAVVLGALAAMGVGLVTAQNSGVEVRVEARRLADGRIEFAVAQRVDGEWSERILPSSRYFPTNSEGRWLRSSPVTVGQRPPPTIHEWEHFESETVEGRHFNYSVQSTNDGARLFMSCQPNGSSAVLVLTDEQLTGDRDKEVVVTWRFTEADAPTQELWWSNGDSESAIFPPVGGSFIRALRNANGRLFISVRDIYNETVSYEFNVAGAPDAAATLGCLG